MARIRVGLDIGSTAVRAAELSVGSDPPALVRAAQVPLAAGTVENGEVKDIAAVADAVRELWRRGGFKTRDVALGVGSQRVVVREVTVPAMPERDLRQSLPFQVQELIPIPLENAVMDFDVLDEVEIDGQRSYRLFVVAAQREILDQLVEAAEMARLEPLGIDLIPFALIRSVAMDMGLGLEEADAGEEALVDIGADVTNICVHDRGVPRFVRILPSGGRDVLRLVAGSLGIPVDEVEAHARGEAVPNLPGEAPNALRNAVGTLVDEVRSSLDFYQAQTPDARIGRVLVTGGGSKLPDLLDVLASKVPSEVGRGRVFEHVRVRLDMDDTTLAEAEPLLAVAVGLALPQEGARR
ncbi:MAG: type IV pilus assembly protein PilM [Actinomycetota bacterium]